MKGKNILIVGASSGIGAATTSELLALGANVYSVSRSKPELSGHFHWQEGDVVNGDFPSDFLPDQLDGVVYCPGTINLKPFRSFDEDAFLEDYKINVLGAVKTIKAALRPLKKADGTASIVLFSTVAVQQGMSFHSSIAAAKGAIEGLSRSLAAELAPRGRVNCVAPSLVNTPLAGKILSSDERIEASKKRHPLQRVGEPIDIAKAVTYLLSDDSAWVTGQVLGVDGGLSRLR